MGATKLTKIRSKQLIQFSFVAIPVFVLAIGIMVAQQRTNLGSKANYVATPPYTSPSPSSTAYPITPPTTTTPYPSGSPWPSASPSSSPTPQPEDCHLADVNQDGFINALDFSLLANDFFSTNPTVPRTDMNQDGIVNLSDFNILARNFLEICPVPTATPQPTGTPWATATPYWPTPAPTYSPNPSSSPSPSPRMTYQNKCWNEVMEVDDLYVWQNHCTTLTGCASFTNELTTEEQQEYLTWKNGGSRPISGCDYDLGLMLNKCWNTVQETTVDNEPSLEWIDFCRGNAPYDATPGVCTQTVPDQCYYSYTRDSSTNCPFSSEDGDVPYLTYKESMFYNTWLSAGWRLDEKCDMPPNQIGMPNMQY